MESRSALIFAAAVAIMLGCGGPGLEDATEAPAAPVREALHVFSRVPREAPTGTRIKIETVIDNVLPDKDVFLADLDGRRFMIEYTQVSGDGMTTLVNGLLLPDGHARRPLYRRLRGGTTRTVNGQLRRRCDGMEICFDAVGPFDAEGEVRLRIHSDYIPYFVMGEDVVRNATFDETYTIRIVGQADPD